MGGREGGEGWRTPRRAGGQTRSRRVSGAGSVRCGRRGCAAAEVLCCSTVPGGARTSPRSPARAPRFAATAARGPFASARLSRGFLALNSRKPPHPRVPRRPVSICQLWDNLRNFGPRLRAAGRWALAKCGVGRRRPARRAGAWRTRREDPATGGCLGRLPLPPSAGAPGPGSEASRGRSRSPLGDEFPHQSPPFPFLSLPLFFGGGGEGRGGVDGRRADAAD